MISDFPDSYVSMFRYLKEMEKFTKDNPDLVLNLYFEDMLKVNTSGKHVHATNTLTPLILQFYIEKLGYTGYTYFVSFNSKHKLWELVRTTSLRWFPRGDSNVYPHSSVLA